MQAQPNDVRENELKHTAKGCDRGGRTGLVEGGLVARVVERPAVNASRSSGALFVAGDGVVAKSPCTGRRSRTQIDDTDQ
jgi:hypothetical protein